jgi:hypothetical protein
MASLRNGCAVVVASWQHGRVCVGAEFIPANFGPAAVSMYLLDPLAPAGSGPQRWDMNSLGMKMNQEGGYLGMIFIQAAKTGRR